MKMQHPSKTRIWHQLGKKMVRLLMLRSRMLKWNDFQYQFNKNLRN